MTLLDSEAAPRCSDGHEVPLGASICPTCGKAVSDEPDAPQTAGSAGPTHEVATTETPRWGQPSVPWGQPPERTPQMGSGMVMQARNGFAVAALVLGIVGSVVGLIPILAIPALACGILAVIFGVIAHRRAKVRGRRGMAIAGWLTASWRSCCRSLGSWSWATPSTI